MKIVSLVGARPQFIKEAVIHNELKKYENIKEVLIHSGQHYDFNMSDVFFQVLDIKKPEYFLNVGSGLHGEMTGKIMMEFEKVVMKEKPDLILVYGDTNTTLAGAIVGAKLKIPVAHIEAGIRQKPKDMPEEINRVLTDHISTYLFCPTKIAVENLEKENIIDGVYFVGDVMYDLYLLMEERFRYDVYEELKLRENEYILLTLHRDFNVDRKEKLEKILKELNKISKEKKIVFPIHPRTRKRISEFSLKKYLKNLIVIDPIDYLNLMGLVKKSWKIITDSGGLQKESYFARRQAVVLMPDTGWRELIEAKWNILATEEDLYEKVFNKTPINYPENLYGNGNAGEKIGKILEEKL
ncbi:UDP-N-acetylglucosamine 2-epimerase [Thermosipho melanesiensis]|uniref:UDP-N-acetylglucosamine 2-epimerase n=2 Tax=Thermosipho melanesiensis TaxID=46541 RepID=A6LJY4_THEM4|nr:UDP-N-acetylglucosamine 2-epimerase (non-hydrolyzing) [Thermosipho melanesiensis]ABR30235.1 UDP-N-acetylglucosamine 2-epimerase [Thermosipho melanesiensis BI429]APT73424.1 UDP-N-acetylglucosamine 2-epimerase [Thermosipho melanesiensis]OOC37367.1 UDP-N-acetylglucosamine 2-epimerase [Thermosipho melanesiensis]OOC39729.1 UDP-N-acetylglucosamine 2-epimerase [Thermosipho melanesiensis]OOC39834.1 UDP-N-acetylglucosamine 2-epimerase [Thermosipho melanesiensis]